MLVPAAPQRIVSLVPSVTETLFALGLGERVVGVTDWCVHPAEALASRPSVGGTKNPRIEDITALRPDLVLANREENREIDIRRLRARDLTVWVDYPRTVADALTQIEWLAALGADAGRQKAVLQPIHEALSRAAAHTGSRCSVLVLIWRKPWMALGPDTYGDDLLTTAGFTNVLGDAPERYPRLDLNETAQRDPEVVLLPDEPYRFTAEDARELAAGSLASTRAAQSGRIHVCDGTLLFWHGPRIAAALDLFTALAREPRECG